jgi:molybdate transport system ATP-binding protein
MSAPLLIDIAFAGRRGAFLLDAAFVAPARGVTGLFGPSGCGKTSVLRAVAGLDRFARGRCVVAGDVWQDATTFRPAHRRPLGYVFQEASLFPHLSVRRNLTFGAPRPAGEIRFDAVVDLLGLTALLDRAPHHLSGGERQRVAIGRALLSQPKLLLMDEPLSALDAAARSEILPFLERLHETLAIPILLVSHDMREIERLADHLVLMRDGKVAAAGPLAEMQSDPALPLAAARDAAVNLDAVVADSDCGDGLMRLAIGAAAVLAPRADSAAPGARMRLRIAASDVSLVLTRPGDTSILNILPATIISAAPLGEGEMLVIVGLSGAPPSTRLVARITRRSWRHLDLAVGRSVFAQVKGVSLARG